MFAVEDDWIQYEAVPARRTAVRGGAVCAQRLPVVRAAEPVPLRVVGGRAAIGRPASSVRPPAAAPGRRRLRLTRRGRVVLVVLPGLLALSGSLAALAAAGSAERVPAVRSVVADAVAPAPLGGRPDAVVGAVAPVAAPGGEAGRPGSDPAPRLPRRA